MAVEEPKSRAFDILDIPPLKNLKQSHKEIPAIDDPQSNGGQDATLWKPTNWNENNPKQKKRRMNVELGHTIFGHRAINSLMAATKAQVWDDVEMIFSGDSWCNMCKIAIAPRNNMSKDPMRLVAKPLEYIFIDSYTKPWNYSRIERM